MCRNLIKTLLYQLSWSFSVIYPTAHSLMTTRFFRKGTCQTVSLLDLPGNVLFIPQDSLVGEPAPKKKVQYKGMCEPWWGAQLFSNLVSTCMDLMSDSVKCKKAGVKVEQGVYGQKQEIVLNSVEPLTLLLEFWGTPEHWGEMWGHTQNVNGGNSPGLSYSSLVLRTLINKLDWI